MLSSGCSRDTVPSRPNVVLLVVDTLRADRLPAYGASRDAAPFLDELARRSLVFENAWSPSSWTLPATVSILTSVHPFQHGVTSLEGLELGPDEEPVPVHCIPETIETLAEALRASGYRTYGIVSNLLVGEEVGFDRGFDRFLKLDDEPADQVNARLGFWRNEILQSEPWFLYLHYFDPHDVYHAREPWFSPPVAGEDRGWPPARVPGSDSWSDIDWILSRLDPQPEEFAGKRAEGLSAEELDGLFAWIKAAYDSEIGFVDARIREVFESFGLEDAVVIFLSDHGEEFYEHGDLTHGQNIYAETVRVPLFVHLPGGARSGRVDTPVSTLDVVPTLRRLLGLPASEQDEGRDLLAARSVLPIHTSLEGKSGQHPLEDDLRSVARDDRRLIVRGDGSAQLYDISRDPLERADIAAGSPEVVAELRREIIGLGASARRYEHATCLPTPADAARLERLRAIGYLGDGAGDP
jgi:arylsulfatase A-like enzyme